MFIHRSNRMECLLAALSEVLSEARTAGRTDPFAPDTIVVQSQGMARWLSLRLAERFSVWANPSFPFPRAIIEQLAAGLLGPPEGQPLERDALALAVAARLPHHLSEPAFAPLARYLDNDLGADRLLQLAQRVGRLLDDYAVFRSDWVEAALTGQADDGDWQTVLMRELSDRFGAHPIGARRRALLAALQAGQGPIPGFPERLCVFGISSLPPLYLELLVALSERLPLHLFLLSPTGEFWADLRSAREQERMKQARGGVLLPHVEEGHPLLASLGKLGRDLFTLLEQRVEHYQEDSDAFVDPGTDCLLHALQADILHLRARGPQGADDRGDECPRLPIAADDESLQVHICHSPTREVEVLHDQVVAALQDPELSPGDIVVMAPDIEAYAPAIAAVFGQTSTRPAIPFQIADRGLLASHPVLDALLSLLDLLESRLEAPAVLDVLSLAPVRERFEVAEEELETVRAWVDQVGIRWGVDADHRSEVGQPPMHETTWRFGLERLMLGYAMEGDDLRLFAGRLPYDDIEGGVAALLGRFSDFCEALFQQRLCCRGPCDLATWRTRILALIEAFLAPGPDGQAELSSLRGALDELASDAERTGLSLAVGRAPFCRLLQDRLDRGRGAVGFMTGGVTFCQLLPMRSIPFSVVALLGMDDGAFPRTQRPLGFDKRRQAPRLGDRSVREDDRYLFLEAIISARKRLIITYVGRGVHDNSVRPPSVLVAELLDHVNASYRFEGGGARSQLCVEHRLQPFSPAYYGAGREPKLFSYARHYYDGAVTLQAGRANLKPSMLSAPTPFLATPLSPPPDAGEPLTVPFLSRYLGHPVRAFLQERIGVFLGRDATPLEPRERMELDALSRWEVGDQLLRRLLEGHDPEQLLATTMASGRLPLGVPGELAYRGLLPTVEGLAQACARYRPGGDRGWPSRVLSLSLDGQGLTGDLSGLFDNVQLMAQYGRVGRRSELVVWLRHVLANLAAMREPDARWPTTSVLVGRSDGDSPASVTFSPLSDPESVLRRLLAWIARARSFPLPFACEASRAYASAHLAGQPEAAALAAARKHYEGQHGEAGDAYLAQVYPDFDRLVAGSGPGFAQLALEVYTDMLSHRAVEATS